MRAALVAICLSLAMGIPAAGDILFQQPIDCTLGTDCFIHDHVDRDPSAGISDFACGHLTRDGHKGTDFALHSLAEIARGVDVLAAAPGVVAGIRDRLPDIAQGRPGAPDVAGEECGNGVGIRHGNGWFTQYCHLKRGSVTVAEGDRVSAGDVLGQVGLSGMTNYPHLHFDVRRGKRVIDPFHADPSSTCGGPMTSLWELTPAYVPTGIIRAGIMGSEPVYDDVKHAREPSGPVAPNAAALILWVYAYGGRTGDEVTLTLTGPGGVVVERAATLDRDHGQYMRYAGRKGRGEWAPGRYLGQVSLKRDGKTLDTQTVVEEVSESAISR